MSTAAYPQFLPGPSLSGASLSPSDNTVRSDSDGGAILARQRSRMLPGVYSARFVFKQNELGAFEYWYKNIIGNGMSWFSIAIAGNEVIGRFEDGYSIQALSGYNYAVTGKIEIYEMPTITAAQYG